MTTFPSAGMYGPEAVLSTAGVPATSTPVTVYLHGTTTAANLYTDQTQATAGTNPVDTDSFGNLVFFAVPGLYDLSFTVGGVATTLTVQVHPWEGDVVNALNGQISLFGMGSNTLAGTAPAIDSGEFLVQAGEISCTVFGGDWSITFPTAFPNGVLMCMVTTSDSGGGNQDVVTVAGSTKTAVNGQMFRSASPLTGTVFLQFHAIGF